MIEEGEEREREKERKRGKKIRLEGGIRRERKEEKKVYIYTVLRVYIFTLFSPCL